MQVSYQFNPQESVCINMDSQVYIHHLNAISEELKLVIEEAIADRAYGTGEILQAITEQNIKPYIQPHGG